jgi:hypothetical protein
LTEPDGGAPLSITPDSGDRGILTLSRNGATRITVAIEQDAGRPDDPPTGLDSDGNALAPFSHDGYDLAANLTPTSWQVDLGNETGRFIAPQSGPFTVDVRANLPIALKVFQLSLTYDPTVIRIVSPAFTPSVDVQTSTSTAALGGMETLTLSASYNGAIAAGTNQLLGQLHFDVVNKTSGTGWSELTGSSVLTVDEAAASNVEHREDLVAGRGYVDPHATRNLDGAFSGSDTNGDGAVNAGDTGVAYFSGGDVGQAGV